ncbi:MAG: hypothetical protein JWP19_2186 [Rhodoglobus sp.]|nr:hypothetical protein [Rhodoglobus sp.]
MSGRTAKAARRIERARPAHEVNAAFLIETAERILRLDLRGVPLTRVAQFIVGWLRAAFEESRAIALLTRAGVAHAAAPNRRSFAEIVVRLQWLHGIASVDRAGALDAMLEDEKDLTRKFFKHLSEMGYDSDADLTAMDELVTEVIEEGRIAHQAKRFVDAAKATNGASVGLYYAWREETQYTHATGALASSYAPDEGGMLGKGTPPVVDPDLDSHRLVTMLSVTLVYHLLIEEGVESDVAKSIVLAFFESA